MPRRRSNLSSRKITRRWRSSDYNITYTVYERRFVFLAFVPVILISILQDVLHLSLPLHLVALANPKIEQDAVELSVVDGRRVVLIVLVKELADSELAPPIL